jgi:hypothetical protein
MKACPYCGAKYPNDVQKCLIDHETTVEPTAAIPQQVEMQSKQQSEQGYDFLPPTTGAPSDEWIPLLEVDPSSVSVKNIMLVERLMAHGISARIYKTNLAGGWYGKVGVTHLQIHAKNYDAAKAFLDEEKRKMELLESVGKPWKCPKCGEMLEPQFISCWKCGISRKDDHAA